MRKLQILWIGVALSLLVGQRAWAQDRPAWSAAADQTSIQLVANTQQQPSLWDRVSNGTKNMVSGAKDLVTLKKKPTPPPNPWAPKPKQKSWFERTFGPADPPKPQTPSEWISQPRPKM